MLLVALALSLIVGLLRGGKISRFGDFSLKNVELIVLAFLVQVALRLAGPMGWNFLRGLAWAIYAVSFLMLAYAIWGNRQTAGVPWILAGVIMNFIAIMANGGKMPVSGRLWAMGGMSLDSLKPEVNFTHQLLTPDARLPWLTDVLRLPKALLLPTVFSAGDVAVMVGLFILVQVVMKPRAREGMWVRYLPR